MGSSFQQADSQRCISLCASDEPLFISMLAPFLRYLYCEPQRLSENALLRHGLLRVLLQHREVTQGHGSDCGRVTYQILHCLFNLFPHILVSVLKCGYELFYYPLERLLIGIVFKEILVSFRGQWLSG